MKHITKLVVAFLVFALVSTTTALADSESIYKKAEELLLEGKYTEAAEMFETISSYQDASKCAVYARAWEAYNAGNLEDAIATFEYLGDYKDCAMVIQYLWGVFYEAQGDYEKAADAYRSNPFYKDSKERAEKCDAIVEAHHWDSIGPVKSGLIRVERNDKYYYINLKGEIVFEDTWERIRDFREGFAAVKDKNEKWGYIDTSGNIVIPCRYESAGNFGEGLACTKETNDGGDVTYNWIDANGDTIFTGPDGMCWDGFSEGLALVIDYSNDNPKYMFIDHEGNVVLDLDTKYEGMRSFHEGLAAFDIESDDFRIGWIDMEGNEVIPCNGAHHYLNENSDFSDGCAVSNPEYYGNAPKNYIDKTGSIVLKTDYITVYPFINGYAIVGKSIGSRGWPYDVKLGLIDKAGNIVIDFQYDEFYDSEDFFTMRKGNVLEIRDHFGNIVF